MVEGLRIVREPLLATPQAYPPRPASCAQDEVWTLLCQCMATPPAERPGFGEVARQMGTARQALGGAHASWL